MARPYTIALGQMSAEASREASVEKAVRMTAEAADKGADVICFPEIGMTPFFPQYRAESRWFAESERVPGGLTCDRLQKIASEKSIGIVVSIYECAMEGVYYDTAAVIDQDGSFLGVQRMMHIAEEPLYNEKFYYKPGNSDYPVFTIGGVTIGIAVCQDQFFPEQVRILALHGAELIMVPTAISAESDPMLLASQSGAALNQVFFAGSNRVGSEGEMTFIGKSHVVDPTGELVAISKVKTDDVLIAEVDIDFVTEVRRRQNFWFRDRRPETYGDLIRPLF